MADGKVIVFRCEETLAQIHTTPDVDRVLHRSQAGTLSAPSLSPTAEPQTIRSSLKPVFEERDSTQDLHFQVYKPSIHPPRNILALFYLLKLLDYMYWSDWSCALAFESCAVKLNP